MNQDKDQQRLHILLVEPEPAEEKLLQTMLLEPSLPQVQLTLTGVDGVATAKAALQDQTFDAICYDLAAPGTKGLAAIDELTTAAPKLPLIVLAGDKAALNDREIMRRGAQDCLLKEEAGQSLLIRSITHAIERMRTTQLIQTSEAKYRSLFEHAADAIFLADATTGILLEANPAAASMLGVPIDEIIGKHYSWLHPREDAEKYAQVFSDHAKAGRCQKFETVIQHRDGERVPVEVSSKLVTHEHGEYIIATARDISERKAAAAEIAALARFPEESPNAVLRISNTGEIEYGNPAGRDLLDLWEVEVHDPPPARFTEIIARAKSTKTPQRMEEDYDARAYSLTFTSSRGADYVDVYGMDITEQKELEDQLRQADKMRAIGELAGGIAHDFNNQLAPIMGYAQMLESRLADDPTLLKYARTIMKSSGRAAELTKQLLAYARRTNFQAEPVNVHKVISDVMALLERSIPKSIILQTKLNAGSCTVEGDPAQLESCLLNIALNARDAMPDGGTLTFHSRLGHLDGQQCRQLSGDLEPGRYLQIEISDTGEGIAPDIMPNIFDPFFTTKELGEGTGMGLAAAYGTVKQHAGAIEAESEPGQGTVMRLYLPVTQQDDNATRTQILGELKRGTGRILVVDDEPSVRELAGDILQMLGYDVFFAENGVEGVKLYREKWEDIDLVVLDMSMPELSGKDAYLQMKEINQEIKAIIASGFGHDEEMNAALDAGVNALIRKPYRLEELSELLDNILNPGSPS